MHSHRRSLRAILLAGAALVVVALLMLFDYLTVITSVLQAWTPAALRRFL